MITRTSVLVVLILVGSVATTPVLACGDSEAGLSCDDSGSGAEMGAKWMLKRVVATVDRDGAAALIKFTKGTDGFRTADTYVFCVGPDGMMNAHPNPILQGHNVHDLHDKTGNYFIRTMLETAKSGQISSIRYLFPKPGGTIEEPKTTYYTRAGDQMCAVGVYDADVAAPQATTPEARVASLRAKLDGEIPASAKADWTAFLEALNAQSDAKAAAVAEARRNLAAAATALTPTVPKAAAAQ
jgi:hypothetical protein